MTTVEYLETPESLYPTELAFGVLRVADSPMPVHQRVVARLFLALHSHVHEHGRGEVWLSPLDVILDLEAALVVQPDLFFISKERALIVTDRVRGAPDLTIEILSPSLRVGTMAEHIDWFARYGVEESWYVHPIERWVDVLTFADGRVATRTRFGAGERLRSRVLPDFPSSLNSIIGY